MRILSRVQRTFGIIALAIAMAISADVMAATEDVVHMSDGRVLHGQIVSETPQAVVFDYMNTDLGISVTMTLPKAAILKIDRDVEVADAEPESKPSPTNPTQAEPGKPTEDKPVAAVDGISRFYIIDMEGQVGTDIRSSLYDGVIEEIKAERPDVVIIKLDSAMVGDSMLNYWTGANYDEDTMEQDPYRRMESIMQVMDDQEDLVKAFRVGIPKDIRQVVWVHDATGPAAMLALAWPDIYMTPEADLGSLGELWSSTQGWPDADVRSKMEKAWLSTAKGIMQFGGHSDNFMEGLLNPSLPFSFSCVGRQPFWYKSYQGDLPISVDKFGYGAKIRQTIDPRGFNHGWEFDASVCEDLLISEGTAETLEDLALLLNERQYQVMETKELSDVAEYKDEWRGKFDRALQAMKDYQKYMQRAEGGNALSNLQKAKKELSRVLAAVRTNESVAVRIRSMTRLDELQIEIMLEDLQAQIRQITRGGRGGGNRGGGIGGRP